ncbi:glycosyltransferase [Salinibacterium sp.]|uniref:glycosyltransferase n=1 Tax=Salinibacterium sp. TaxID=1915057 RepID=UPI00286BF3B4|nr:glycosyltransferase [Salinibacterium sp.]
MTITGEFIVLAKKVCLHLSYEYHRRFGRGNSVEWIVGPYEVANMVIDVASALPSAESAVMAKHPFYQHAYDWQAPEARTVLGDWFAKRFRGPIKLGELAARADGFIYIGGQGFITASDDRRRYEFQFLKRRGKRVVCYFTGNDVRSPELMAQLERERGEPNLGTYLAETNPLFASSSYETYQREIAATADEYADVILTSPFDNSSHITRPTEPFLYFFPDERIATSFEKFEDTSRPVILHAPSSPVIKGTQLVRAAVAELRDEGYDFDYVELLRQPHEEVVGNLARAHIVLNQFYSMTPGVFGIEALAAGCVVMMSPSEDDEPTILPESRDAWIVTRHYEVTRNLRRVLDCPESWEAQARAGVEWVRGHASYSVNGPRLASMLAAPDGSL